MTLTAGCTYTMTAVNNNTDGPNAFPDILGSVTLVGNGATITRSSAGGTPDFRFFLVDDGGSLNISNVTLSNGSIASGDLHGGGAILNRSILTASGVTFANNVSLGSTGGGAIDNHDTGQLTVNSSTFTGNSALQGGGIEDEATLCHTSTPTCGQATVTNSTFINNSTTTFGGGGFEAQLDNTGTGIPPVCTGSFPWPVMPCQEPGGAHDTLTADTFTGNSAVTEGGGIASFGTMSLSTSTLYNNSAGTGGGGGVQNTGTITITSSTIASNTAPNGADVHSFTDTTHQPGVTGLAMSIVSGGSPGANCSGTNPMTDNGYNLDSGNSCGFASHALVNTDPMLGALASNGGPTQTMAVLAGSPAIDAIPSATSGCTGTTDQRGVSRPQGSGCEIGAFEVDTTPPSVPAGLHYTTTKTPSVVLGWSASTDNVGVTGYDVYRDGSGTPLATVSASTLTYEDTAVMGQTNYSYTVDAFDAAGNHSAQSAAVVANPGDVTPPSVPGGLSASATSTPSVVLNWSASSDNVGVTGYTIYRGGSMLTTVPGNQLTFEDTSVVGSTTYTYTVDAFDAAANHSAQSASASATTPQIWSSLGGTLTSSVAVSASSATRMDVFVRGTDNALYQRTWNGSTWSPWASLGGTLTSNPSAVSSGPNRIDVFVRGTDKGLYQRTWNGTTWSPWVALGGILTSSPGTATRGAGLIDVFVRGTDNGLYHKSFDGTSWSAWEGLGGTLSSDPTAVAWGPNRIDVFVRGTDSALYQKSWNGTSWGGWSSLGGTVKPGIGAASCTSGHLDIYVLGSDNAVYHLAYNGAWGSWQRLGGSWTSGPSAICPPGTSTVSVFVRGTDLGLWQSNLPGT